MSCDPTPDHPPDLILTETTVHLLPTELAREHQRRLLDTAGADRRSRVVLRMRRAERRAARRRLLARSQAVAAQDAARQVVLLAHRAGM